MESKKERSDSVEEEYKDESFIDKPAILDKYKAAAQVANDALAKVVSLCVVGADVFSICS